MPKVKITPNLLQVGSVLEWDVETVDGKLLLQHGITVSTKNQLNKILEFGYFIQADSNLVVEAEAEKIGENLNSYDKVEAFISSLEFCHTLLKRAEFNTLKIEQGDRELLISKLTGIAFAIAKEALNQEKIDAMLSAAQLTSNASYSVIHSIHCTILCSSMALRLELDEKERKSLLCAALTYDFGILNIQPQLAKVRGRLSIQQWHEIYHHSEKSVAMLRGIGIANELWLSTVLQHHERMDGSGYPQGLGSEEIIKTSRILALADSFSAMIIPHSTRKAKLPSGALRELFQSCGEEIDPQLTKLFIQEFGVFHPGTVVSLKNGETAIVTRRGASTKFPEVYSILNSQGVPNANPVKRNTEQDEFSIVASTSKTKVLAIIESLVKRLWPS